MASAHASPPRSTQELERTISFRPSLLSKLRLKSSRSIDDDVRGSTSRSHSPARPSSQRSQVSLISGVQERLPCSMIEEEFTSLRNAIDDHVHKFYTNEQNDGVATQAMVEHASTGIMIPWPQVRSLLYDSTSRLATLTLCISWTVLSRSLMLKLGISNSPGSTFLPPEIVECFQSFSLGKGAVSLKVNNTNSVNFALLSRWKRISATLLHSTYVEDAFSHFDSRTVNIERALKDLDPLLATYAMSADARHIRDARITDLRDVLRKGAKLAFTLFSQPSFWKFDWQSDRAAEHGKIEQQVDPFRSASLASEGSRGDDTAALTPAEIVIWPTLLRVMDGEGIHLETKSEGEGSTFGQKIYMLDYAEICRLHCQK